MKILLVEPDAVMSRAIQRVLVAAGHTVQWRRSAQTGLDGLDHERPDVIVLETQLGLHNGIEFLYEMRSYPEWHAIPVVIHSMSHRVTAPELRRAFQGLNVHSVLYKPRTSLVALCRAITAANLQLT
jgi:DNA-binding response OmpR family regulator